MPNPYDEIGFADQGQPTPAPARPAANPYDEIGVLPDQPAEPRVALRSTPYLQAGGLFGPAKPASVMPVTAPTPTLDGRSFADASAALNADRAKTEQLQAQAAQPEVKAAPLNEDWSHVGTGLGTALKTGAQKSLSSIARISGNVLKNEAIGNSGLADAGAILEQSGKDIWDRATKEEKRNQFESDNPLYSGLYSGAKSALQMGAAIAASGGNPVGALAGMVAPMGIVSAGEAVDKGVSIPGSIAYGGGMSGLEYLTEKMPLGFALEKLGKTNFTKLITGYLAREMPSEQIATMTQDALQKAVMEPGKTWGQYWSERPRAALETAIATAVPTAGLGAAHGTLKAIDAARNNEDSRQAADEASYRRLVSDMRGVATQMPDKFSQTFGFESPFPDRPTGPTTVGLSTSLQGENHGEEKGRRQEEVLNTGADNSAPSGIPVQPMQQQDGMPIGTLQDNAALHQELRDSGHRVSSTGVLYGAPDSVKTNADLVTFRNRLQQLADEGKEGKMWYEDSGKAVLKLAEGDKSKAEKIVGLLAIYSPQQQVSGNTTLALKAFADYVTTGKVVTISNMGQAVADKAQEWMDGTMDEAKVTGIKRSNFYRNLMREIAPETMGADAQGTTVDMHMARAGGYYTTKISAGTGEDSSGQYQFMDREIKRVANEFGWEPQQAQAAIWGAIKERVERVMPQVRDIAVQNGWMVKSEKPNKYGKTAVTYKPTGYEGERAYEKMLLDEGMKGAAPEIGHYSFGDAIKERIAQVSWEARPSVTSGILPGIHTAPLKDQLQYLKDIDAVMRDDQGHDVIAKRIGLAGSETFFAPSAWEGVTAWGAQTETAFATDRPTQGKVEGYAPAVKLMNIYAAIRGYAMSQDAVVWHFPNFASTIKAANGVQIDFGRQLSVDEIDSLYKAITEEAGHDQWAPAVTKTGIRVLNFTEVPNKDFHAAILRAAAKAHIEGQGEFKRFGSIGDYIGNDWNGSRNGEDYRQRIGDEGRPDLLEWADSLRSKVAAINEQYAAEKGWGESKGIPIGAVQQGKKVGSVYVVRGKEYDADAPNFGFPADPITLPDNHPLLRNTDKYGRSEVRANGQTTEQLHVAIVNQHFAGKKPAVGRKPKLVLMAGGGGAGKGHVKDKIASLGMLPEGAVDIDPDAIKTEMIPEFKEIMAAGDSRAAAITHDESSALSKIIMARATTGKFDIIFDRTMADYAKGMKIIDDAIAAGYEVEMQAVLTDARTAAVQAMGRASHTGRYVPPAAFLSAHKGIAAYLDRYMTSGKIASGTVWDNRGNALPIAEIDTSGYNIIDPEAHNEIVDAGSEINEEATTLNAIYNGSRYGNQESNQSPEEGAAVRAGGAGEVREGAQRPGGRSGGQEPAGSGSLEGQVSEPSGSSLNQAGANFVYGPIQISEAKSDLPANHFAPALSERDMARRSLAPLEKKQAAVIDSALGDLFDTGRIPSGWMGGVNVYGLAPVGVGLANYNPTDRAIGVATPALDAAAKGEEESQRLVRGWLAHELHHGIDNYRTSSTEMFYLSAESPRMDMGYQPGSGKFVGHGDLANEALSVWHGQQNAPDELIQFLSYPMINAEAMGGKGDADAAMPFAKVELFAQMGAMYVTNPGLMEQHLPAWFGFFEEWNNARGDGSIERSRVTLRGLLQKSVPDVGRQAGIGGTGIAARPVGQNQQGTLNPAGGPGMGANPSGRGNSGGQAVLPATPQADTGQETLALYRTLAGGKVPANDHIPTHVNYSTFSSPQELKDLYAGMSSKYEAEIQKQRRGVVSIKETYADARKLIENESGMSAAKVDAMLTREPGSAAGAAEIMARMAILEAATGAVDAMAAKISKQGDMNTTAQEWLDFAAAIDRAAMAHQTFLGARAEVGRAMNAIRAYAGKYDPADIKSILNTYSGEEGLAKVAAAIASTGAAGVPVAPGAGGTGIGNGRAMAIGRLAKAAAKPTLVDAFLEGWKAGMLSGVPTHLANIIGNTTFTLMRIPEAALAGTIGAITRGDVAHLGDAVSMTAGMIIGSRMGFSAAWEVLKDEDATIGPTAAEDRQHAISAATFGAKGKLGTLLEYMGKSVRLPYRFLGAEDAVFKMVNMYGSLYQGAVAQAMKEGKAGWPNGFSQRVADIAKTAERYMLDPMGLSGPMPHDPVAKAIAEQAIKDGLTYTFQNKLGKIGQWIESGRSNIKVLHGIMPFVRTPLNIFREGLERTPAAPLSGQWRENIKAGGTERDLAMAKAILGTSVMASVVSAVASGMMTGGGEPDKDAKKRRQEMGVPDYSIKINGKWYEYRRIEPLGTIMGAAADFAETMAYGTKDDGGEHWPKMIGKAFTQAVTNKTYMKGMADTINVLSDPERYGDSFIQGFAGSLVPAAVNQYANSQDSVYGGTTIQRETKVMGEGKTGFQHFKENSLNAIQNRLPETPINPEFNRQKLPYRVDSWGDIKTNNEPLFEGSPLRYSQETQDKVRSEAARVKAKNSSMSPEVLGVKLDGFQAAQAATDAGQLAHSIMASIVTKPDYDAMPKYQKRAIFEAAIKAGHEYGKGIIITPEIVNKHVEKVLKGVADVEQ